MNPPENKCDSNRTLIRIWHDVYMITIFEKLSPGGIFLCCFFLDLVILF